MNLENVLYDYTACASDVCPTWPIRPRTRIWGTSAIPTHVFFLYTLAFGAIYSPSVAGTDPVEPRLIADASAAIYRQTGAMTSKCEIAIILAIWPDGYVVWSDNRVKGGAPYREARIDRSTISATLARLEDDGLFEDDTLDAAHFGPDAEFTTVSVRYVEEQVKMQSWHELAELSPKLVARNRGIERLSGRRRLDVLSKEPADYLYFRLVWSETREKLMRLIPDSGDPTFGAPVLSKRGFVWEQRRGQAEKKHRATEK